MSDLEDEDVILDDIKALEAVLTKKQSAPLKVEQIAEDPLLIELNQSGPSTSRVRDIHGLKALDENSCAEDSESECDVDDTDDEKEDENDFEDLSDPEAALNLNRKIVSLLTSAQRRLNLLLKECRRRQGVIDQKIRQRTSDPLSRTLLSIAGIPYFKDKQQFPAPKNQDAKTKASRDELQVINLPCPMRWTLKDRNTLWEAVYSNAKAIWQEESRKKETDARDAALVKTENPLRLDLKFRERKIPEEMIESVKHLVARLGSRELDWLKIANTDFNGRHSAGECRAMWNVFLHPDINKGKWKKGEDSRLKFLVEEYNFQDWDAVARRLGTSRSGYQCFIRFNTNFKNNTFSRVSSWSKEEDQKLTDTVNALRTGNFIPWGEVAKLMGNRRKQQVYMRWNYSLAPNLKKGRFTEEEDRLLLQGVARFGSNFTKISVALLPHRTTAQLNDHYRTLMNEKKNDWNYENDMKLVKLFDKFGNNWAAIAKEFSNKSRVQVRHRHTAIVRYLNRGLSIRTIPRWGQKKEDDTPEEILARGAQMLNEMSEMMGTQRQEQEAVRREHLSKIDMELRDYFKGIYPASSKYGRVKKFYSLEELDEKTQKLYVVLKMLNADLDVSDNLEEEPYLTEKDKQLLTSLAAFAERQTLESEPIPKYLEYVRRKMFGTATPSTDEDRFIPPLPFNGKAQRSKGKKLVGINYHPNGEKYLVELTHEFHTAEAIMSLLGGWEKEVEFQKMEKVFIPRTGESSSDSTILRVVLKKSQQPLATNDFLDPIIGNQDNPDIIDQNVASTSGLWQENLSSAHQSSSRVINRKLTKYYPEMLIPPNYTTLLGFRGILLSKHVLEAEDPLRDEDEEEENTITVEGENALELFEERLVKLFKFPIELSEIAPPLLHGVCNAYSDDIDTDNCRTKRKRNNSSVGQVAKRQTKLEDIEIKEISKAQ